MPQKTLTPRKPKQPTTNTYAELLRNIRLAIDEGKDRATQAVEKERKRTKWETGKLILDHILLKKERAEYGQQVTQRLAKDLEISHSEILYMVAFARANPISPHAGKLSWDKERDLLSVNDRDERLGLAAKAEEEDWSRQTLRKEIKKLKAAKQITDAPESKPVKLPDIQPGQLGLFSIFELGGKTYRDLGFSTWQEVSGLKPTNYKEAELYTYEAEVTKVFDGDTFHVLIHLKDDLYLEQRVRLRRLDAPELMTGEGQQAKKVLQKVLNRAKDGIVIKVSKSDDQYGRYLVDTWVNGVNIDQELLAAGVFEVRG
jgi:endonuclease YncB( thermonuclease family)